MNTQIFREYDIRGIADRDLTDSVARDLGAAFGTLVSKAGGAQTVSVSRDCRISSDRLFEALSQGILSTGIGVTDLGVIPTPLMYFSLHRLKVGGGIQITGSHNPPEHNGFKLCKGQGTLYGAAIQELRRAIEQRAFVAGQGSRSSSDIVTDYKTYILSHFKMARRLKVVIDAGNGMGGMVAPELFQTLGVETIPQFCEVDGRFPNHHPDPTVVENLKPLQERVLKERADLGVAYDGDADRVGIVDDRGEILWADRLLILLARDILKERRGAAFIADVKCSNLLFEDVARHGGRPILWKTGHSLIKAKMKEERAVLGGEMSGHLFFSDRYFGFDDAIYASLRVVELVAKAGVKLSELSRDIPATFSTPEIRVECPEEKKFEIVKRAVDDFRKKYKVNDIDGVRIDFPDGWGLLRASNTQPVLVMRFEARTQARLAEIRSLVESKVSELAARV